MDPAGTSVYPYTSLIVMIHGILYEEVFDIL